jgi:glyoxylate reductase
VGYDNVDLAEATRRGIPVSNTPGVLTTATAEMAWALLLAAARRVVESDRDIRSGAWSGWGPMQYLGTELRGRTLGVVGAGRIGTAMALMSRGFDMKVIYYQPSGDNETLDRELGARKVELDRLLAESDFISIHTPLTPQTRHLFNADAFRRMKNTAYLINTSRGPVVNEADLLDALTQGRIAGAGLDVYEFEPQVTPGLTRLKNVVVAAHTGSATHEARNGMAELAAKNLLAMLKGQTPPNCLNPDVL